MYGGYRASFLITAVGVAICAVSPGIVLGCVGAVIFGAGNGIGLVCNLTLIQQTVSDDRRGQIFAVLGSLVQMFTLLGTLAAGPLTELLGPRAIWGLSAALLVIGYLNAVVVSGVHSRRDRRLTPQPQQMASARPATMSSFDRIAMLMDEVELTRAAEATHGVGRRRGTGSQAATTPPRRR